MTEEKSLRDGDGTVSVEAAVVSVRWLDSFEEVAQHWGLLVAYGVTTTALGVVLAVWPKQTIAVCAILVAIQFLVSGVLRVASAIGGRGLDGGMRAIVGFAGVVGIIIGLLCLRHPLQTVLAVTLLLGIWWLLSGAVDIFRALFAGTPGRRGWDLAMGALSMVVGAILLIDPKLSLTALVVVACVWMIGLGVIAIIAGLRLRHLSKQGSAAPEPPAGWTTPAGVPGA